MFYSVYVSNYRESKKVRSFFLFTLFWIVAGSSEAKMSPRDCWLLRTTHWQQELAKVYEAAPRGRYFSDASKRIALLIEGRSLWSKCTSLPPMLEPKPRYAREKAIVRGNILNHHGKVWPQDLLRYCLEANNLDKAGALTTCHDLMKDTAAVVRRLCSTRDIEAPTQDLYDSIATKLISLRPSDSRIRDHMGPWYHIFVVGLAAFTCGGVCGDTAVFVEHTVTRKWITILGGYDAEKRYIDQVAATAFSGRSDIYTVFSSISD